MLLRIKRCKNCGQIYMFNPADAKSDVCEIMASLKKNQKVVSPDSDLERDYPFIKMRTTADGLYQKGKEFEYYISDKNQYDTVINFLEKNSIIFAKNSPYFWSRSREEDLQPCPVCESKEKYENYRIFRDKTNGTISKSQFLSPEFKYIYKFPAEYEEYMRDMNELHNSEDDEIINPEYCALLEESKNCVNHSQLSNAFDTDTYKRRNLY